MDPRVFALDIQFPFTYYVFVEKDSKRVADLEKSEKHNTPRHATL